MAVTIEANSNTTLAIDDYVEFVDRHLDPNDLDAICGHANVFAALLNNGTIMADALNAELRRWRSFQTRNHYSAQTFLLGRAKHFVIRANVWTPPSSPDGVLREWEDKFYYYRVPHDHNFSFLTGGYYGSGYQTTIYEYDYENVVGEPGEPVAMRFLEKTRLPKGKIMLYRASKDIHSQEHPEEFSISVNLLVIKPQDTLATQYLFDLDRCKLTGPVQNTAAAQTMLCETAKHVGNLRTADLLDDLSVQHANPRFRYACMEALAALCPGNVAEIGRRALNDPHPFVRTQASVLETRGLKPATP
jgi:hypothetical protein